MTTKSKTTSTGKLKTIRVSSSVKAGGFCATCGSNHNRRLIES